MKAIASQCIASRRALPRHFRQHKPNQTKTTSGIGKHRSTGLEAVGPCAHLAVTAKEAAMVTLVVGHPPPSRRRCGPLPRTQPQLLLSSHLRAGTCATAASTGALARFSHNSPDISPSVARQRDLMGKLRR